MNRFNWKRYDKLVFEVDKFIDNLDIICTLQRDVQETDKYRYLDVAYMLRDRRVISIRFFIFVDYLLPLSKDKCILKIGAVEGDNLDNAISIYTSKREWSESKGTKIFEPDKLERQIIKTLEQKIEPLNGMEFEGRLCLLECVFGLESNLLIKCFNDEGYFDYTVLGFRRKNYVEKGNIPMLLIDKLIEIGLEVFIVG